VKGSNICLLLQEMDVNLVIYKKKENKEKIEKSLNRHAGQAGWRSQGGASHSGNAAARHRPVVFSYACIGWLYRHQSVARTSFVGRQDVLRAGQVGLRRDYILPTCRNFLNLDLS
jgi:hypothetical protein